MGDSSAAVHKEETPSGKYQGGSKLKELEDESVLGQGGNEAVQSIAPSGGQRSPTLTLQ